MQLSGLETMLLATIVAGGSSTITALVSRWYHSNKFITVEACKLMREKCSLDTFKKDIQSIRRHQEVAMQMLRILMEKNGVPIEQRIEFERDAREA